MRRHYLLLAIVAAMLLLSGIALAVSNPFQTIVVIYNESVIITGYNLSLRAANSLSYPPIYLCQATSTQANCASTCPNRQCHFTQVQDGVAQGVYTLRPSQRLPDGSYNFTIEAVDTLGNAKNTSQNFTLIYTPLSFIFEEPSYGVSQRSLTNVTLATRRGTAPQNAECRWSRATTEFAIMAPLFQTGGSTHKLYDQNIVGNPTYHFACNDTYYQRVWVHSAQLSVDTQRPSLSLSVNPSSYYEGSSPFTFDVRVSADEPVLCRYDSGHDNYADMNFIMGVNDPLALQNKTFTVAISDINGRRESYSLRCQDRAGHISDLAAFSLYVNLTEPNAITLEEPRGWSGAATTAIRVSTRKTSFCQFRNATDLLGSSQASGKSHSITRVLPEGEHSFSVVCESQDGTTSQDFRVYVDRTPPTRPNVTITSRLPQEPGYTHRRDRLDVTFSANDTPSGIAQFNYTIKRGSTIIARGAATVEDCDDSGFCETEDYRISVGLESGEQYRVFAVAVDRAGLASTEGSSDYIRVNTSLEPQDATDPRGNLSVTNTSSGARLRLQCTDPGEDASGCDSGAFRLGHGADEDDCELEDYTQSVTIDESSWVCWEVYDEAGNKDSGGKWVDTPEPSGRGSGGGSGSSAASSDVDHDLIANLEDNCPDIRNPNQEDSDLDDVGNECDNCPGDYNKDQEDADGDGVGDACDTCPDEGGNVNRFGCPTAEAVDLQSNDKDNDGMADDWELTHGLNPDDLSDASLDPDNDGLSNLQEYQQQTNPNKPDTDGDGAGDGEEVDAGTDPIDPNSKPEGGYGAFVIVLILIIILGIGGYVVYLEWPKIAPALGIAPKGPRFSPEQGFGRQYGQGMPPHAPPLSGSGQQQVLAQRLARKKEERETERKQALAGFGAGQQAQPRQRPPVPGGKPAALPGQEKPSVKLGAPPEQEEYIELKPEKSAFEKLAALSGSKSVKQKLADVSSSKDVFGRLKSLSRKRKGRKKRHAKKQSSPSKPQANKEAEAKTEGKK